ncbi:MAG: FHA domain-containing protein [Deltaproteobacteria bacterium]|nr:FHA domain-containing protein [Deltaproteobacteria bacterium]
MGNLAVVEGEGNGVVYKLGQRVLTIGRGPANLIQLLDQSVSRRHATIMWDQAAYRIRDLKSKNGVMVNDRLIQEAHLQYGDLIRVGRTLFKLVEESGDVDDSVLSRRIVSRESVDSATMKLDRNALKAALAGADPEPTEPMSGPSTEPVDVDAAARAMDDRIKNATSRLQAQVRAGQGVAETINSTLAYIIQTMDADRCIAYRMAGARRLEMAGMATIPHLDKERRAATPYARTVQKVVDSRRAGADNDVQDPIIFGAAAVPVESVGELVGVIYADSMRRNPRYFIEHDLEMLQVVSGVLSATFSS